MNAPNTQIAAGQRVRFIQSMDRFPHFVVKEGEEGTLVDAGPDFIDVRMDRHIPEAAEWDNCVVFSADDGWDLVNEIALADDDSPWTATVAALDYYTERI